jgi:hypothetical protein
MKILLGKSCSFQKPKAIFSAEFTIDSVFRVPAYLSSARDVVNYFRSGQINVLSLHILDR